MSNLPEQAHQSSTAVATRGGGDPYAIDQTMIKLPSLYLGQFSSKAFKAKRVEFGDIYVAIGAEDPEPQVVGQGDPDKLSTPVRFYVHAVQPGYQIVDKDAPYGKRSLRPGTSYQQALQEAGGDPRNVFQQAIYTLTIPDAPQFPVRFIMGSKWGGPASRWINTQIAIAKQNGKRVLDRAFQVQTRPTTNGSDEFVDAVVGFADVPAKTRKADQEIVELHASTLASGNVQEDYSDDVRADASEAPSLA